MDIVQGLKDIYNNVEYKIGDKAKVVSVTGARNKRGYVPSIGDIVEVVRIDDKSGICSEKEMEYCNKISKGSCIKFSNMDDEETKYIWSCYCEVERI